MNLSPYIHVKNQISSYSFVRQTHIADDFHELLNDIFQNKNINFCSLLNSGKVSITETDHHHLTFLHWAIHERIAGISHTILKKYGCDYDWIIDNKHHASTFDLSIAAGNQECFDYLIDQIYNEDKDATPSNMKKSSSIGGPLSIAILSRQSLFLSKMLRNKNIKKIIDIENSNPVKPLHLASLMGDLQAIRDLIAYDPTCINEFDSKYNWTPLFYAAYGKRPEAIALLFRLGADLTATNRAGFTAQYQLLYDESPIASRCKNIISNFFRFHAHNRNSPPNYKFFFPENLIFSGGWDEQIALAGALMLLEKENLLMDIRRVAGSGVSSITAALFATGATPSQLQDSLKNLHLFLDKKEKNTSMPENLQMQYSILGKRLKKWIEKQIYTNTGIKYLTFKELNQRRINDSRKYKKLHIYLTQDIENNISTLHVNDKSNWKNAIISDVVYAAVIHKELFERCDIRFKDLKNDNLAPYYKRYEFSQSFSVVTEAGFNDLLSVFDDNQYHKFGEWGASTNRKTLIIHASYTSSQSFLDLNIHYYFKNVINKKEFQDRLLEILLDKDLLRSSDLQGQDAAEIWLNKLPGEIDKDQNNQKITNEYASLSTPRWEWKYGFFLNPLDIHLAPKVAPEKNNNQEKALEYEIEPFESKFAQITQSGIESKISGIAFPIIEREELTQKIEKYFKEDSKLIKVRLLGWEGSGKTEFAIHYIRKKLDKGEIEKAYIISGDYFSDKSIKKNKKTLKELKKNLKKHKKWIVLIDSINLKTGTKFVKKHDKFFKKNEEKWEELEKGIILLTIQDSRVAEKGYKKIWVPPLSTQELRIFFNKNNININEQSYNTLDLYSANFPILLRQILLDSHRTNRTIDNYLGDLNIEQKIFNAPFSQKIKSVFDNLILCSNKNSNYNYMEKIIIHLAFLGREAVPTYIIDAIFFSRKQVENDIEMGKFYDSGFIQCSTDDQEIEKGYFKVHPLIQAMVRQHFKHRPDKALLTQILSMNIRVLVATKSENNNKKYDRSLADKHIQFLKNNLIVQFADLKINDFQWS